MGKLLKAYLMPHPPIMVGEVGRGNEKDVQSTIDAAFEVSREVCSMKPDTVIIVVPPHGPAFGDALSINIDDVLTGDLGSFGAGSVDFSYDTDREITNAIIQKCSEKNIPVVPINHDISKRYNISSNLDHGSMVPLYFINKGNCPYKLVHITYGLLSNEELYKFGSIIRESVEESSKNAVFIASGDLSHRLTHDAPAGFNPKGEKFDSFIVEKLKGPDSDEIMYADRNLVEAAGECGYRSIIVLLGVLDGLDVKGNVLSYEGPFGVGYCITRYDISGRNPDKEKVDYYFAARKEKVSKLREKEDAHVKLARESLEYYLANEKIMHVPSGLPGEMIERKAGVFVSIKKNGELRGCIGTIGPVRSSIAEEIIYNAVSAGVEDPRFYPVEEDELDSLVYSVDVLGEPEDIESSNQLDPKRYGVIVRKGGKSGLLLPNLEGVDTVEEQVKIALSKAGIRENEDYSMERFEVVRYR